MLDGVNIQLPQAFGVQTNSNLEQKWKGCNRDICWWKDKSRDVRSSIWYFGRKKVLRTLKNIRILCLASYKIYFIFWNTHCNGKFQFWTWIHKGQTFLYTLFELRVTPTNEADVISCSSIKINPLNPELNPICYLLALLAHHFLHVRRIRVKLLTFRLLVSYIYGAPILDVSRSHTTTQHSR